MGAEWPHTLLIQSGEVPRRQRARGSGAGPEDAARGTPDDRANDPWHGSRGVAQNSRWNRRSGI